MRLLALLPSLLCLAAALPEPDYREIDRPPHEYHARQPHDRFSRLKDDLESGRIAELKEHSESKYEVLDSETIELTHSYREGDDEVFYTPEGVEYRCARAAVEEQLKWTVEAYKGLLVDGHLVTVSMPGSVIARVAETSPPMKGAGGSGTKDALLENGVKVRVGLIVATGDRIRLDPETLEYKERVQG